MHQGRWAGHGSLDTSLTLPCPTPPHSDQWAYWHNTHLEGKQILYREFYHVINKIVKFWSKNILEPWSQRITGTCGLGAQVESKKAGKLKGEKRVENKGRGLQAPIGK